MREPKVNGAFFPRTCVLCGLGSGRRNVCRGCRADLPWLSRACRRCGAPLPPAAGGYDCATCRVATGAAERIVTALAYEYPVDRLVTLAKFQVRQDCARALGDLLAEYLRAAKARGELALPDMLTPVPLHRRRLARRGYNQAEEIAMPVAEMLRVPLARRICRRHVDTAAQTSLTGVARRKNVRGAFRIDGAIANASIADASIANSSIAIVDDVLTTGSTVGELAAALRAAGAAAVQVWTVARSVRQTIG
ncbi:MAG: ComF family protein [Gammaproteobacteria bacterium]